jgi:EmrB/QacA subfamily drug resistance transporter
MKIQDVAPADRVMVVAILVSMVAFLDSSVVNLALPLIDRDLHGGLPMQQWVVDGYLLAMAALILPAGSIADLFGRLPVMRFGLAAFGVGSVLAATAVSPAMLITARIVQGSGAAFLVPGSLALINSAFESADQSAAIGSWTAWTGTAFALGPLLGGLAVDYLSWRWIYVLSSVPMAIGFVLTFWLCPMPGPADHARVDIAGAGLSSAGLAASVYALIESQQRGWADPAVSAAMVCGILALLAFVTWERSAAEPMVPPRLLTIRNFAGANLATAFIYGGLGLGTLVVSLYTQEVAGYSATAAGFAMLPIPIMSFLFARHVGAQAARVGPRIFLVAGPVLAGIGMLLIAPSGKGFNIATQLLPGMTLLAVGLVATVTPLTSVALASVQPARSGIASAINNAVSRIASLITVACIGLIAAGTLSETSSVRLLQVSAVLFFIGAVICAVAVTSRGVAAGPVPVPCAVGALCRDRPGVQPALATSG